MKTPSSQMHNLSSHVKKNHPNRHKNYSTNIWTAILLPVLTLFLVFTSTAQPVAGPEANPRQRMNCPNAGTIRADNGSCVAVESYFSTGTNKVYWVSQSTGSDSNPGTKSKPWKTISRSNRAGVLRPGDVVIIRRGVYRETIAPKEAGTSGRRITFAAYPGESVVISGADPLNTGWTKSGNAWRHTWTQPLPAFPRNGTLQQLPEFRREMVIVNTNVLTPVFSRAEVVPGTFYVEGTDKAPKAIYMRLPGDQSPTGKNIQVGRRSALFLPKGARENWCGATYGWYRLVGLTFRHAVNNANWSAVCSGWEGSLLEENTVEWTNGTGINLQGRNNVLRGNHANDNGMRGIGGRCNKCRIEYNETSRNNWKDHSQGFSSSGIKLIYTNNTIINRHVSRDNNGTGIWFDVSNADNVIENSVISGNRARGILLELETIRTLVRNNIIFGTTRNSNEGNGIQTQASSRNTIAHNTIMSNWGHGIFIRNDKRAENGYNKIYNNLFINNATFGGIAQAEIKIDGTTMTAIRTNKLNGNLYWRHTENSGGNTFIVEPENGTFTRTNSLAEWRSLIGSDAGAGLVDGSVKQVENRNQPSGWRLVSTSKALGWATALPSGIEVQKDIEGTVRPTAAADVGAHEYAGGSVSQSQLGVAETGTRSVAQSNAKEWHRVSLTNAFTNPVVIMSPLSYNGNHPATMRVRNVTSSGFEFQVDEWDYLDGAHLTEKVHYAVFEAGRHDLGGGQVLEAGIVTRNSNFARVTFGQAFGSAPLVVSQIVTVNDPRAAVTRQRNVTASGFDLIVNGEEAEHSHGNEKVAYVAISKGKGKIGSQLFTAGTTPKAVTHKFYDIGFGQTFPAPPVFLSSMQTAYGMDTATLRFRNLSGSGVEVMVEEEQSKENETLHTTEIVGYLAIESALASVTLGNESNEESLAEGADVSMDDESKPKEFRLVGNYPNPFNPETTIRYELPEDVHVQLEVYDMLGRRVALLVDELQRSGAYEVRFNGADLASGMYLYRLQAGAFEKVSKMILMK